MSSYREVVAQRITGSTNYKWWAFAAIAVGLFTLVAEHGSIVVALPTIADGFRTDLLTTQWIVIGYALTISALLLPAGRLSDMLGLKRIYLSGFVVFALGAVLAGFSTNIVTMILFRVLQGAGAAMTQGTAMAMLVSAFPRSERGRVLGLFMSVVGVGAVSGPALGGVVVGLLGWRWVFFINFLLAVLSTMAGLVILDGRRTSQDEKKAKFDWLGAALSTAALVTFLLAVTNGPRVGWSSPLIVASFLGFWGFLGAFVWWELRVPTPMLDVRLFTRKLFSLGVTANFFAFIGTSSVLFLMPFYLQSVLGYTPIQVGLILVPAAFSMIVLGPVSGRLSDRYGWRKFNVGGLALSATGLFLLSTLQPDSPLGLVMAGMILLSCGNGTFYPPNNSSILSTVEQSKFGVVSGFLQLVRNLGNITGIALATAIVTATMASMGHAPTLAAISETPGPGLLEAFAAGLRTAYLAAGSLVVVGIVVSFFKGGKLIETERKRAAQAGEGF